MSIIIAYSIVSILIIAISYTFVMTIFDSYSEEEA